MSDPIRIIYSDVDGINNLTSVFHKRDLKPGVYALVGPIENHVAEPEFQDALAMVAVRRNYRFKHLSFGKFVALLRRNRARGRAYVRD